MKGVMAGACLTGALLTGCTGYREGGDSTLPDAIGAEIEEYFAGDYLIPRYSVGEFGIGSIIEVELVPEELETLDPDIAERLRYASAKITGIRQDGAVAGSGFLLEDGETGDIRFITAGHVVDGMNPETINIYTDDRVWVDVERFDVYYNDAGWGEGSEDVAIGTLDNAEGYRSRALTGRDMVANPLRLGEQLFASNFQGDRAHVTQYGMIFFGLGFDGGPSKGRFAEVLGNIDPLTEDYISPGASGGVIVDTDGQVVGLTVGGYGDYFGPGENFYDPTCLEEDEQVMMLGRVSLNDFDRLAKLDIGDWCRQQEQEGFVRGYFRVVGPSADLQPRGNREIVSIP